MEHIERGYFKLAWGDIKNSPGWFSKVLLLALIKCIPIFGTIVEKGYMFGWARDIAWDVKSPMPQHIFGNEDGRLYSRGFFVIVLEFVLLLIPSIFLNFLNFAPQIYMETLDIYSLNFGFFFGGFVTFWIFSLALYLFVYAVSAVGAMRISIYGTLSSGFCLSRVWAMIRKDFKGLLRIAGMYIAIQFAISIIIGLLIAIITFVVIFMAIGFESMNSYPANLSSLPFAITFGFALCIVILGITYAIVVCSIIRDLMVSRSLGYWTRQFDVASWGSQKDPMPFEYQV